MKKFITLADDITIVEDEDGSRTLFIVKHLKISGGVQTFTTRKINYDVNGGPVTDETKKFTYSFITGETVEIK